MLNESRAYLLWIHKATLLIYEPHQTYTPDEMHKMLLLLSEAPADLYTSALTIQTQRVSRFPGREGLECEQGRCSDENLSGGMYVSILNYKLIPLCRAYKLNLNKFSFQLSTSRNELTEAVVFLYKVQTHNNSHVSLLALLTPQPGFNQHIDCWRSWASSLNWRCTNMLSRRDALSTECRYSHVSVSAFCAIACLKDSTRNGAQCKHMFCLSHIQLLEATISSFYWQGRVVHCIDEGRVKENFSNAKPPELGNLQFCRLIRNFRAYARVRGTLLEETHCDRLCVRSDSRCRAQQSKPLTVMYARMFFIREWCWLSAGEPHEDVLPPTANKRPIQYVRFERYTGCTDKK